MGYWKWLGKGFKDNISRIPGEINIKTLISIELVVGIVGAFVLLILSIISDRYIILLGWIACFFMVTHSIWFIDNKRKEV